MKIRARAQRSLTRAITRERRSGPVGPIYNFCGYACGFSQLSW